MKGAEQRWASLVGVVFYAYLHKYSTPLDFPCVEVSIQIVVRIGIVY